MNVYEVIKYVMAESVEEAIKKEKKAEIDSITSDGETDEGREIGFHGG